MKNLNKWISIFATSICLISLVQASERIDDLEQIANLKNQSNFQLIQNALEKIKNGESLDQNYTNNIKKISISQLKDFECKVDHNDEIFDSWITFILTSFPKNFYFDNNFSSVLSLSLNLAKNKAEGELATPEAQKNLGGMYINGQGVKRDLAIAFGWIEKAAMRGNLDAQNTFGIMYKTGQGVQRNLIKAFEWFEKAANQGYFLAQNNLGKMYETGRGVQQDSKKALEWYEKAADQGQSDLQFNLGVRYSKGEGVQRNKTKAFEWFKKSAIQGYTDSQYNLGTMYKNGEGVAKNLTAAFEWYEKAAIQGHSASQYILGAIYYNGEAVDQDKTKSLKWFLEGFKSPKPENLTMDCKNSIRKLITFLLPRTTLEDEINFKMKQETLKKDLTTVHNIILSNQNSDQIVAFENDLLKILTAYDNPGFMVTCLRPNDIESFKTGKSPDVKYYSHQGQHFLTFGQQNVQTADQLMEIILKIKKINSFDTFPREFSTILNQLEDLLIQGAPYRSKLYLKENPHLEALLGN